MSDIFWRYLLFNYLAAVAPAALDPTTIPLSVAPFGRYLIVTEVLAVVVSLMCGYMSNVLTYHSHTTIDFSMLRYLPP